MIEIWRDANKDERNLLRLIFGIVGIVALFGISAQVAYYTETGSLKYPVWRLLLWAAMHISYLVAITHHMALGDHLDRLPFAAQVLGICVLGLVTIYLLPEAPGWLLLAPMAGSMGPFRGLASLPFYLVVLSFMVLSAFGYPANGLTFQNFVQVAAQMSAIVAFTAIFSGLQRQLEDEKAKLQVANQKLAAYAAEAEEIATIKERNRLAREIHDNVGHYLTVVNVQLEAGKMLMARNPDKALTALEKAQRLTQEGLQAVRDSVSSLREGALNKPLEQAIGALVEQMRVSGVSAEYRVHGTPAALEPKTTLTLYRAAQEALTNVRKYAEATQVAVTLDYRSAEMVHLTVEDNGIGSDNPSGGFGLVGIQERVNLLGGKLAVISAPNAGFHLNVSVPKLTSSAPPDNNHALADAGHDTP